jgi:hypothetical protein
MLSFAAISAIGEVLLANLAPAVSLGIDVFGFVRNARARFADGSGGTQAELDAATAVVDRLAAAVDARVEELGRLAPNS